MNITTTGHNVNFCSDLPRRKGCILLKVKRYGTITGIVETIRYFIGTAIGILNYAKYTLSVVPDINLKRICCLSGNSVRCWYRVPVYSPTRRASEIQFLLALLQLSLALEKLYIMIL